MKSKITEYILGSELKVKAIFAQNIVHEFARHSHESYVICGILHGARVTVSNGVSMLYTPGEVCIVEPYQEHSCFSAFDGSYDYVALSIPPESLRSLSASDECTAIAGIFRELFECLGNDNIDSELAQRIIKGGAGWRNIFNTGSVNEITEAINKSVMFINDNYALKIALDDIAEYVSMSKYNFQRSFVKQYGMSPAAFIDKKRVASALSLIKKGGAASSIALECGFSDQSHLCRVVKKVTGVTIKNYFSSDNP